MDKKALRREIAERKRKLSSAQIKRASLALAEQLFAHPLYKQADAIYVYLSYNQEVRTQSVICRALADGKRVAVPKVVGEEMVFLWLTEETEIAPGYCGIPEPVAGPPAEDETALVLMPGLAFTMEGARMGYGGGFYDRFLASRTHPTLALCYDFQIFPTLPVADHDIPVDAVLSVKIEEEII